MPLDKRRTQRNLNPTPEAALAMIVYGDVYSAQRGGSMDFWDGLTDGVQSSIRRMLKNIEAAQVAHNRFPTSDTEGK